MAQKKVQKDTDNTSSLIERLRAFQVNSEWLFLVQVMQENVDFLEEQILSGYSLEPGSENQKLTPEQVDRLRDKRDVQKELMQLPSNIINQMTRYEEAPDQWDPFPQDTKDLRAMAYEEGEAKESG